MDLRSHSEFKSYFFASLTSLYNLERVPCQEENEKKWIKSSRGSKMKMTFEKGKVQTYLNRYSPLSRPLILES